MLLELSMAFHLAQVHPLKQTPEIVGGYIREALSKEAYAYDEHALVLLCADSSVSLNKTVVAPITRYDSYQKSEQWLGDMIDDLIESVSDEDWDKVPSDLASRIEEHLYHGKQHDA